MKETQKEEKVSSQKKDSPVQKQPKNQRSLTSFFKEKPQQKTEEEMANSLVSTEEKSKASATKKTVVEIKKADLKKGPAEKK